MRNVDPRTPRDEGPRNRKTSSLRGRTMTDPSNSLDADDYMEVMMVDSAPLPTIDFNTARWMHLSTDGLRPPYTDVLLTLVPDDPAAPTLYARAMLTENIYMPSLDERLPERLAPETPDVTLTVGDDTCEVTFADTEGGQSMREIIRLFPFTNTLRTWAVRSPLDAETLIVLMSALIAADAAQASNSSPATVKVDGVAWVAHHSAQAAVVWLNKYQQDVKEARRRGVELHQLNDSD